MTLQYILSIISVQGVEVWTGWTNALVSIAIIFVCICRARQMTRRVLLRVKGSYLLLIMGAFANATSPVAMEIPGWCTIFFTGSVLIMLIADSFQWRNGPPESATGPAPLGFR